MMAESDDEPVVPETPPQPEPPEEPVEEAPPPPVLPKPQVRQRTIGGVHDLSNHPAVLSGQVLNAGDTALSRDPNAPNFNRPVLTDEGVLERTTTTSSPAKREAKGKSKGDGAGPES